MIKEKVKALWKLCFEDSEAFIEMYFRLRYNNEVNIAIESGDFRTSDASLSYDFLWQTDPDIIYLRRLYPPRLPG